MSKRLNMISNHIGTENPLKYLEDPLKFLRLHELIPAEVNEKRLEMRRSLEELDHVIHDCIEKAEFPREVLTKLKPMMGLMKESYGCRFLSFVEMNLLFYEVARFDASIATFMGVSLGLVVYTIEKLGSEEQKAKYLQALCNFNIIGCWGLTEPNFGSDASSLQTTAKPVEGGFEITGEKRWIGNAIMSDIMVIWARNTQTKQVEGFIVPTKSKGVRVENIERKLALRMVQNGHIYMDKVFVPANTRLEKARNFSSGTNVVLKHSRISIPWVSVGIMAGVYEHCVKYMNDRKQFGAPLAAYQLNQEKLVRILGHFQASFLVAWRLQEIEVSGNADIGQASLIKGWISSAGREVARLGREIFGGNGIIVDNYVMKAMMDMEPQHTYEGTYDVNSLVAGRAITGVPAFKSSFRSTKKI